MTKAALESAVNTLLAGGQPITAAIHRSADAQIINEMYDAQSRGDVLSTVTAAVSLSTGDKVFLIRSGAARLIDKDVFGSMDGGTP